MKLTLQSRRALAQQVGQVIQVIASRDAELAHEILGRVLEVAVVVAGGPILLGPPEVSVAADGGRALEALEARLGLVLCRGIEGTAAEELVG